MCLGEKEERVEESERAPLLSPLQGGGGVGECGSKEGMDMKGLERRSGSLLHLMLHVS